MYKSIHNEFIEENRKDHFVFVCLMCGSLPDHNISYISDRLVYVDFIKNKHYCCDCGAIYFHK